MVSLFGGFRLRLYPPCDVLRAVGRIEPQAKSANTVIKDIGRVERSETRRIHAQANALPINIF
jgi:hypothetical protein